MTPFSRVCCPHVTFLGIIFTHRSQHPTISRRAIIEMISARKDVLFWTGAQIADWYVKEAS